MRLRWSKQARLDRSQQIQFIAADNARAAISVGDRVATAVSRLLDFPLLGRPGRVPGTRELPIGRSPYIVVYIIHGDTILILRLLHGAMKRDL